MTTLNDSLKRTSSKESFVCITAYAGLLLLYSGNTGMHSNDMISDENTYEQAHIFPIMLVTVWGAESSIIA